MPEDDIQDDGSVIGNPDGNPDKDPKGPKEGRGPDQANPGNRPDSRGPGGPERDPTTGQPVHPRGKPRGEDDQPNQPDPNPPA